MCFSPTPERPREGMGARVKSGVPGMELLIVERGRIGLVRSSDFSREVLVEEGGLWVRRVRWDTVRLILRSQRSMVVAFSSC